MAKPLDYAPDIKSRVTMSDICRQYGISVNRAGFACCPFHAEKTGSMKIYPGNKGWHCFGCGKGGDVLDFVRELFGLTLPGAIERIDSDFGLGLPLHAVLSPAERKKADALARERKEKARRDRLARQIAQDSYNLALDRYAAYDRIALSERPTTPYDGISDDYARAVQKIEYAWYLVEIESAEQRGTRRLAGVET